MTTHVYISTSAPLSITHHLLNKLSILKIHMYSILYVLYNHWVLLCARALRSSVFLGYPGALRVPPSSLLPFHPPKNKKNYMLGIPTRVARVMASPEKICYARESNPNWVCILQIDHRGRQKYVSRSFNAWNILIGGNQEKSFCKNDTTEHVGFYIIHFEYGRGALT